MKNKEKMAVAGIKAFFSISRLWGLEDEQEIELLGLQDKRHFLSLKNTKESEDINEETLLRISHLLKMHQLLVMLFPAKSSAYQWVKKENNAPLFKGETALSYMLRGGLTHIANVRKYLESQCL